MNLLWIIDSTKREKRYRYYRDYRLPYLDVNWSSKHAFEVDPKLEIKQSLTIFIINLVNK